VKNAPYACLSLLLAVPASALAALADGCPPVLAAAERLIMVTTKTMADTTAHLQSFERAPDRGWRIASSPHDIVIGTTGLGWAWNFAPSASPGDPLKREGDNRTPAGIFRIGRPFGFDASALPGYVQLRAAQTFCVDDPTSPHYNRIVDRSMAGAETPGEDMATIDLYRQGIEVDFPTNRELRGGSCIFLHVWKEPGQGTSGCVAGEQHLIEQLQNWTAAKPTAIAILPTAALHRFAACLPAPAQSISPPSR
jgi:L,D-peptidoglycan transpeptidase YkuD (ErfK/YbiS/YcfS/YnhG family)